MATSDDQPSPDHEAATSRAMAFARLLWAVAARQLDVALAVPRLVALVRAGIDPTLSLKAFSHVAHAACGNDGSPEARADLITCHAAIDRERRDWYMPRSTP